MAEEDGSGQQQQQTEVARDGCKWWPKIANIVSFFKRSNMVGQIEI